MAASPSELHLRAATLGDAPQMLAVIQAAFAEHRGRLDPPSSAERKTIAIMRDELSDAHGFVACDDAGAVVGCVVAHHVADALHWERLAVLPAYRGRRLATRLMDRVEQCARELSVEILRLEVRLAMTHNRALYVSRGYRVVGYGAHDGYPAPTYQIMEKTLRRQ